MKKDLSEVNGARGSGRRKRKWSKVIKNCDFQMEWGCLILQENERRAREISEWA